MAISINTTKLSRRGAIAGLAALSTAGAAQALSMPARAFINPDADLIAACKEWLAKEQRCSDAFHATDALHDEAKAKEPPVPPELSEELDLPPHGMQGPTGETWDPRSLKGWAESGSTFYTESSKPDDDTLIIKSGWLPIPEATRTRAAELLAIHERHKRAKHRAWAKYNRAEKAANDQSGGNWDRLLEICEMPTHTIGGLHAKMSILAKADALNLEENIAVCLRSDVARLAMSGID